MVLLVIALATMVHVVPALPLVYNLGLPKSGSTTFNAFMQTAYDTLGPDPSTGRTGRSCHWVLDKKQDWLDPETVSSGGDCLCDPRHAACPDPYFPQISQLSQLDADNPDAKFVLLVRDSAAWARSVAGHIGAGGQGSSMLTRLKNGDIPGGLPPGQ
eukprot:gene2715-7639_t